MPTLGKVCFIEADALLCQLSYVWCQTEDKGWGFWWFPRTYVYIQEGSIGIWSKLVSRRFCEKIKSLSGAKNIDEIRNIAKNNDFVIR